MDFSASHNKLLSEVVGKAAIFVWQIKFFSLVLPDFLYLKSLVQKTEVESLKVKDKNGKFLSLNVLIKLMFKHFPFSKTEQSHIEHARKCRNDLIHFNLMELLYSLDRDQDFLMIGRDQKLKPKENRPLVFSEFSAFCAMGENKKFLRKLNSVFEQAIETIDKRNVKICSEIQKLGNIAVKRNLLPKT